MQKSNASPGRGVDFHCHLDLYPDPAAEIAAAEAAQIYTLTVTTTPKAWPKNLEFVRGCRFVRVALGLHPQLVEERAAELSLWERYLGDAKYVGEVGLDAGPRFHRSLELQKRVFQRVLQCCAEAGSKVLTVHSVRAQAAVLDLIETHLPADRGRIVLHWFTGSRSQARRASELGCYFSVNLEMTSNERGRALLANLPAERLLTETDGPFTQLENRPSRPADVARLLDSLARLRGMSVAETEALIRRNLHTLLADARHQEADREPR